jgi:hypothetical protein
MPSAGAAASRLHRLERRQRAAEEAAGLGLPPGVGDGGLALAHLRVVPAPDLGLDRLADRRHGLEVVVVLSRLLGAYLAQHPDRGRRGVEDVDAEFLGDPPRPAGVGIVRDALVDHGRSAESQRAVHDVGVAGDPAYVGHAPVHVVGVDVLVVLGGSGHVGQVAAGRVLGALGAAGGPAGVHQEQRRVGGQGHRLDYRAGVLGQDLVDEEVPSGCHRRRRGVLARVPPPDQHLVDFLALPGRLF